MIKKIDFILQISILSIVFTGVIFSVLLKEQLLIQLLIIQFFFGIYQLGSALINTICKKSLIHRKRIRQYWKFVILYFLILFFVSYLNRYLKFNFTYTILPGIVLYILPWIIAIYYCFITYKNAYQFEHSKPKKGFLNHIIL